jgi:hypothetical protein
VSFPLSQSNPKYVFGLSLSMAKESKNSPNLKKKKKMIKKKNKNLTNAIYNINNTKREIKRKRN